MQKYLDFQYWQAHATGLQHTVMQWLTSVPFYAQIVAIAISIVLASIFARILKTQVRFFYEVPTEDMRFYSFRQIIFKIKPLLLPLIAYCFLGLAANFTLTQFEENWLIKIARSISLIVFVYHAINLFISNPLLRKTLLYTFIPIATLHAFGWLDPTIEFLESIAFQAGNIRISLYLLLKTAIVGGFFFWLGSTSNRSGQKMIRSQEEIDVPTKELFAKLFQIILYAGIFILTLQVLGLDLTTLTVLGGALAVGVGFGLQQIASNFISGIILLIERSLTVGDFIELEDGRSGILKELNMRSTTLETFDGKEIMVPNEKFITGVFVNWTRDDPRQRYEVTFKVSYGTDVKKLTKLVEKTILKVPGVLDDPEPPECGIRSIADFCIELGVEFWIHGIDDGKNRISAAVLSKIWDILYENDIETPIPKRDVRFVDEKIYLTETTPHKPNKKKKTQKL